MTDKEKQQLKILILKEISDLERELSKFADKSTVIKDDYNARFPKTADISDTKDEQANDVSEYERERAIEQSLEVRLKELKETLEKINSDDYGLCSNCKSPIEQARLKAMPITTSCFNCANKASLL